MKNIRNILLFAIGFIVLSSFVAYQATAPSSTAKATSTTNNTAEYIKTLIDENDFNTVKINYPASSMGSYMSLKSESAPESGITITGNILKLEDPENRDEIFFFNLNNVIRAVINKEDKKDVTLEIYMPY